VPPVLKGDRKLTSRSIIPNIRPNLQFVKTFVGLRFILTNVVGKGIIYIPHPPWGGVGVSDDQTR